MSKIQLASPVIHQHARCRANFYDVQFIKRPKRSNRIVRQTRGQKIKRYSNYNLKQHPMRRLHDCTMLSEGEDYTTITQNSIYFSYCQQNSIKFQPILELGDDLNSLHESPKSSSDQNNSSKRCIAGERINRVDNNESEGSSRRKQQRIIEREKAR